MVLLKDIVPYLEKVVNGQSEAVTAFRNYIHAFHFPEEGWSPKMVLDFFWECLIYPHWQQNRKTLVSELRQCLVQVQQAGRCDLELEHINWDWDKQLIELQSSKDAQEVILRFLQKKLSDQQQYKIRLIPEAEHIYGIILHLATQHLEVRVYDKRFTVESGELIPLRDCYRVLFDAQLNLMEGYTFFLELGPFVRTRFRVVKGLCDFYATRGYLFKKFQVIAQEPLEMIPRLYYRLKKIESLFLKKETNPLYVTTIHSLERLLRQIKLQEPLNAKETLDLIVQAKNALEQVFPDDKLLHFLIKEVEEKAQVISVNWSLHGHTFQEDRSTPSYKSDIHAADQMIEL
ncbi:MAG: hypothetical protein NZ480_08240 [Bdellovibrionaceae bacterium]|nr:hypothetical protein [Pseudobdellovibrionaceae bacterium]MDW8190453.1 hypothetical protein [Pseudobdellovibrionaceae bacterium]